MDVTLVIPGRNCEGTLARCLDSVVGFLDRNQLAEIIFVNDGSTDATSRIAASYPITVLTGAGQGPGAARNQGWRHARTELVWFIDSDCVAHQDALDILLKHFRPNVAGTRPVPSADSQPPKSKSPLAGVGGSYSNLYPDSLLATLIHEEIVARHRRMPTEVNFLATFNVLYRRDVLAQTGGFDESLKLAQDAELAFRICESGYRLHLDIASKVGHHHPTNLWRYLKTQARQGCYRMALYRRHPTKIKGDSYAGLLDYVQPPLAMLLLVSLPLFLSALLGRPSLIVVPVLLLVILLLLQLPMTFGILVNPSSTLRSTFFPAMSSMRAISRGIGMTVGVFFLKPKTTVADPVKDPSFTESTIELTTATSTAHVSTRSTVLS